MKRSTHQRLVVTALAAAAIAAPMAHAGPPPVAPGQYSKSAPIQTSGVPKDVRYPGEGIEAPPYAPIQTSGVPKDVRYPGEGIEAPPYAPIQTSGVPKDVRYPGEGIEAPPYAPIQTSGVPKDVRYPGEGIQAPPYADLHAVQPSDGFDFRDAVIGAGIALGAAFLLAGAALATRRSRRLAHS